VTTTTYILEPGYVFFPPIQPSADVTVLCGQCGPLPCEHFTVDAEPYLQPLEEP
jgi:hypothetical protein